MNLDVAIIGGGPAGSTTGALLKKYNPSLRVGIFEREKFPRDHVGESLLPAVAEILNELGAWSKVEAAGFPIKLGAVYRWGKHSDEDLYYFNFLGGEFIEKARPGKFEGQRRHTTFQVDRSVYDKILLDNAREVGCEVYEQTRVLKCDTADDAVTSLSATTKDQTPIEIKARYYVDASGGESLLRKAFNVATESPTLLRNIAIWDYWRNAEWAEQIGDGTFVYVLSIGYGWIWFIPIGQDRTSIGFITSADYYKSTGKSVEQIYLEALAEQPLVTSLTANATREYRMEATKDWSFVAERFSGENWFLVGDACGFADPILAAGLTLAQTGAKRVAYSILESERGEASPSWIRSQFDRVHGRNIRNHIRFADYWYSANEQFSDLKQYCSQIAAASGLTLGADEAFQWLGTGGFADELNGLPFSGTYTLSAIKQFTSRFSGKETSWKVYENNIFHLATEGAIEDKIAVYHEGRVHPVNCLRRGEKVLPLHGFYKHMFKALQKQSEIELLAERFIFELQLAKLPVSAHEAKIGLETLEALVAEGWVSANYNPNLPLLDVGRA